MHPLAEAEGLSGQSFVSGRSSLCGGIYPRPVGCCSLRGCMGAIALAALRSRVGGAGTGLRCRCGSDPREQTGIQRAHGASLHADALSCAWASDSR